MEDWIVCGISACSLVLFLREKSFETSLGKFRGEKEEGEKARLMCLMQMKCLATRATSLADYFSPGVLDNILGNLNFLCLMVLQNSADANFASFERRANKL